MRSGLTKRIIVLSIFWIVLTLMVTALLITWLYRDHIEQHYDAHLFTHVEELVAAVQISPDGDLSLFREPTDPRFHRLNSGWYWQVMMDGRTVARSPSLNGRDLDIGSLNFDENHDAQTLVDRGGDKLRARVMHMAYKDLEAPVTILATAPQFQIMDDVADFRMHIALSFLIVAIGLSLAVVVQVTVALRPLKAIRAAISDVQTGATSRLPRDFPDDVQPLVDKLNSLLDHNETLLKRARTQLADLAHALNTPLTIIRNEARNLTSKEGQLILDQAYAMTGNIDHYLTRARASGHSDAFGYQTSIKSVVEDLRYAVERMYGDRDIGIELCSKGDCRFRGDGQDLEEMLGNLIENACKWANEKVEIRCRLNDDRLTLSVEDDGPGIPEEDRAAALERGRKLDESTAGYGQGLSIVRDIAELYGGEVRLESSLLGGLRVDLELPAAL
ncbi:MAG: ATP-binding protein [Xanthomonadales bacterium]